MAIPQEVLDYMHNRVELKIRDCIDFCVSGLPTDAGTALHRASDAQLHEIRALERP